jgi:ferredoxin-nitrate reductase
MFKSTRDSIAHVWGDRTPHSAGEEWSARVDERVDEEPDR